MERVGVRIVMAAPHRFFALSPGPVGSEIFLEGEEFVHAKTVLRVCPGTEITLLDNTGKEYSAIVDKVEKARLSAHITGVNVSDREAKTPVYLLCGALKGDKTELVVQKATELGVKNIGIFSSEYCSAYVNSNKLERFNKVAREAAKQCLRPVAPTVEYFEDLASAFQSAKDYNNKLFFCEFAAASERSLKDITGSTALVVGSEGGFSQREADMAKEYGFAWVSLGKRILRAETAAISVCALAEFCLGELE